MEALLNGHFPAGLALSREEREVAVEQLSALACIADRPPDIQMSPGESHTHGQKAEPVNDGGKPTRWGM